MEIEKLSPKQLRQRLFVKQSSILYNNSEYTFNDNVPEQIELLPDFQSWESFSDSWDILWVGLDPRTLKWIPGRHNSPVRKLITPLKIVFLDERSKRMMVPFDYKPLIDNLEVPFKEPLPESEEDRAISESLSGRVIIDEPDHDKAIRAIMETQAKLQEQLDMLLKMN